ncbi:MAG TPA: hypothetical protein VMB85_05320 [Bryobacteraceae bacterium]|nr:hypothetical protein [Bryobacteraceae bacterium]
MKFVASFQVILGCMLLSVPAAFSQTTTSASFLPPPPATVSTVPSNGDVNPYGVAFAPAKFPTTGVLMPGDILVSNFNNSANLQGTGSTVVRVDAHGVVSTFYQGSGGLGLTAALGIVRHGLIFVGNMPTTDGTSATVSPGSMLILNRSGNLVGTLNNPSWVNGPWGMAIHDEGSQAQIFISNVLSGTITRLDVAFFEGNDTVSVIQAVQIAGGYNHRLDPAALVLGPSGLYYNAATDTLYVASSADNAIYQIANAGSLTSNGGTGTMVYSDTTHLHGPLNLVMAPNGDLLVANSDGSNVDPNQPSEIVEFTTSGSFVNEYSIDPANGGAFGLGMMNLDGAVRLAAVDDNQSTLTTWTVPVH